MNIAMMRRVRNTTLSLLIIAIGTISSPSFGQTVKSSSSPVLKGKNVTVYLEDAEFGVLAEKFAYDPNARLVDIQEEPQKVSAKNSPVKNSGIMTAHFAERNSAPAQSSLPKKVVPRPLGTNLSAKPLLGKPQKSVMDEFSFDTLSQISLTR